MLVIQEYLTYLKHPSQFSIITKTTTIILLTKTKTTTTTIIIIITIIITELIVQTTAASDTLHDKTKPQKCKKTTDRTIAGKGGWMTTDQIIGKSQINNPPSDFGVPQENKHAKARRHALRRDVRDVNSEITTDTTGYR